MLHHFAGQAENWRHGNCDFNMESNILQTASRLFVKFLQSVDKKLVPIREKFVTENRRQKLILLIASVTLLLDNMLYMVIVPIITEYFQSTNGTIVPETQMASRDTATGCLFASKAIVQLAVNPFTGVLIDRVGYIKPLALGLMTMFLSTFIFACASSFALLFVARSFQGIGSALADTASLGLIADRFQDESSRSSALGIALAFISFGSLVAPPFGGFLFEYAGREWPFLILSVICLSNACLLTLVLPKNKNDEVEIATKGTPVHKLFFDPYIAVIAVSLAAANFPLAFLEPTIAQWMKDTMSASTGEVGLVWLPAFIPHVIGVYLTVKLSQKYARYQWLYGSIGLVIIGVSTAAVPTCKSYGVVIIPLATLCFGIALIDTALLPTLAFIVDVRHTSVYGSVYAIADISYCFAYGLGPILAGGIVRAIGYLKMNVGIGIANIMISPLLLLLREVYDWKKGDAGERQILLEDGSPLLSTTTFAEKNTVIPPNLDLTEEFSRPSSPSATTISSNRLNLVVKTSVAPRPRPRAGELKTNVIENYQ